MKFDCIERRIGNLFARYGKIVAHHPTPFIVVPVVVAVFLASGFAFFSHETDVEYLFTPQNSQARKDQVRLVEDFADVKDYDPSRTLDLDLTAMVIITHQTAASIWEQQSLDEIFELDDFIKGLVVDGKGFADLCQQSAGVCVTNGLDTIRKTQNLTFPFHEVSMGPGSPPKSVFFGYMLGGVTTTQADDIVDVQAMQLVYFIQDTEEGRAWARLFISEVSSRTYSHVQVAQWQLYSIEEELAENTERIIPYFSVTFTILITFSITATMLLDPVRSRPWLGFCGVISAGMAIVSGMGFLMYCGLPFIDLVAVSPFLVLGLGVDDMFVMLAAWRKTDHYLSMEDRLPEAFSEAAMSITITSVTDVLAVCIGAITPFPAVRTFCAYTGLMLFMDYIFQLTFFAGCMAVTGRREAANRHAWTCKKVPAKSEAGDRGKCYLMCCTGGVSKTNRNETVDDTEVMLMKFFRDHFAPLVNHVAGKVTVFVLTLAYLGVAIWGCTQLKQGLELENLAPDDSYVADFYHAQRVYFTDYEFGVQVVVHSVIDSKQTADRIHELIAELESTENFRGSDFTKSWLREYEAYAVQTAHTIDYASLFGSHFDLFLQQPAFIEYAQDVEINGSVFRFIVMSHFDTGTEGEMEMMLKGREIADNFADLDAVVYSPRFIFTEQYVEVFPNTMQNLGIAVCCMLVISLMFIPHPVVSIYVSLSILSIIVGVVGFMSLWQINLDTVSMINLIMCIGFCVDFSAHITYAFVKSEMRTRSGRATDALHSLGMPILQGSVSTILGVIPLAFSLAYIFRTFFKVMFLVILFGTLHGLFVLPAVLSTVGPKGKDNKTGRIAQPVLEMEVK